MRHVITVSREDKALIISLLGSPGAKGIYPLRMIRIKFVWPPVKQFRGFLCQGDIDKPPD